MTFDKVFLIIIVIECGVRAHACCQWHAIDWKCKNYFYSFSRWKKLRRSELKQCVRLNIYIVSILNETNCVDLNGQQKWASDSDDYDYDYNVWQTINYPID